MATQTTAQHSQNALNIAVALQNDIQRGVYEDPYFCIADLCAAVIALAQIINANASILTSTAAPAAVALGAQYSATQATTTAVATKNR